MPVRSLNSSILRWPDKQTVDIALRQWAQKELKRHPEAYRLGCIGSYAKNNWGVGSDIDIVVLVEKSDLPFSKRNLSWNLHLLPVPADLFIYTKDEWERMGKEKSKFYSIVMREAIWVYTRTPQN